MKKYWEISPALGGSGNVWSIAIVTEHSSQSLVRQSYGSYRSLKAAQSAVAHMNKKAIRIAIPSAPASRP